MTTAPPREVRTVICILNDGAGSDSAGAVHGTVRQLFEKHGLKVEVYRATGREITALAKRAVEGGASVVVAGGGDGTINGVASALVHTQTALGVLPLGTLNHFAKDLKIPLELEAAVANVVAGDAVRVDVGEVNGRFFLNNSSLGLYPAIVREREEQQRKGRAKWLAFAQAAFYALRRYSQLYVNLHAKDSSQIEDETPFVFVGNNRYETTGLRIGERAHLNNGRLWICSSPRATRVQLLRLALRALRGVKDASGLKTFDSEEIWVHTKSRHLDVATDGEVSKIKTPLHYRVHPRALRVIVPGRPHGCKHCE